MTKKIKIQLILWIDFLLYVKKSLKIHFGLYLQKFQPREYAEVAEEVGGSSIVWVDLSIVLFDGTVGGVETFRNIWEEVLLVSESDCW